MDEITETPMAEKYADNNTRDVSDIWADAIRDYRGVSGKELKDRFAQFNGVEAMIRFGGQEMDKFHKFRHDSGKVDKLRGLFSDTMWLIEAGTQQAVAAAVPVFPPAAAIGTALTYMLSACKEVSADYDVVTTFFVDLNLFLRRMTILEKRLPKYGALRQSLFDVFASLLTMCGFATKYIELKRFKKWVMALFKGGDSELVDARANMDKSLKSLESDTQVAILGNTVELERMNAELKENSDSQSKLMQEQVAILQQITEKQDAMYNDIRKLLAWEQERRKEELVSRQGGAGAKASGKGKPATSARVRSWFGHTLDPSREHQLIYESIIPGTGTWIFDEPAWKNWANHGGGGGDNPSSTILAISGPRGAGKSHLAVSAYNWLRSQADEYTCVGSFYFREGTKDYNDFYKAIAWIIVQIAEQSATLCEKINQEISRDEVNDDGVYDEEMWESIIEPIFRKPSKYHLQIVLDGVDELDAFNTNLLFNFLRLIGREHGTNVSVICTLRPHLLPRLEDLNASTVVLSKEMQSVDMKTLIWHHLNKDSRLRRFDQYVKQRICAKLEEKADCLLYAEHMLRHFNTTARQSLVLKQLETAMPQDLEAFYASILSDLESRINGPQQEALKVLLAWLAYSYRPLALAECLALLGIVSDGSLDLEAELQGTQLARFLTIAHSDERISSDGEQDLRPFIDAQEDPDLKYSDSDLPLKFQERSMRGYFRQDVLADSHGLRTSSAMAHQNIFLVCSDIVNGRIQVEYRDLRRYAARNWAFHLSWSGNLDTDQRVACLEGLGNIMTNSHGAADFLECLDVDYDEISAPFVSQGDLLLRNMSWWSTVIGNNPDTQFSQATLAWAADVREDKQSAFVPLMEAHIANWSRALDLESALKSYRFARTCAGLTGHSILLQELSDDDEKARYDEKEILGIAQAFGDMLEKGTAAWAKAAILEDSQHHESALDVASKSLSSLEISLDRFRSHLLLATIQTSLDDNDNALTSIQQSLSMADGASRRLLREAYVKKAEIHAKLEDYDGAIESYGKARQSDPDELLKGDFLQNEFRVWHEKEKAMDLVKNWTPYERLAAMTWEFAETDTHLLVFMKAAIKAGEGDLLVETYKQVIRLLDNFEAGAPLRVSLAQWYLMSDSSDANLQLAKEQLLAVLDTPSTGDAFRFTNEWPADTLHTALSGATDAIYEQFRFTADRKRKKELLVEVQGLLDRELAHSVPLAQSWLVHWKVVVAKMVRKMGPASDYQQMLEQAFRDTLDALEDNVSWNDGASLVTLAEVLSSLAGLEREAQIALSAMFSKLDRHGEGDSNEQDDGAEDDNEDAESLADNEGDLSGNIFLCNGDCEPNRSWRSWKGRRMYQCLTCDDACLCEPCYQKRVEYNNGRRIPPGGNYCGKDHQYLVAPIEGWRGIKDGIVTIQGEEPFSFKDWLKNLKEKKWQEAWRRYWLG